MNRAKDEEAVIKLTKAYLASDIQAFDAAILPQEVLPWPDTTQVPLHGNNGRRVGILAVQGNFTAQEDVIDLIALFTALLGRYLYNQLLLRQLEEKANIDSLTGFCDRNYVN